MKLSVIILNYNVRYFLELCIKSVIAATENINSEIIVVDNHSEDESCEMVKTLFPQVKLIENKVNVGFSKGNNIGVSHAIGEYICILNPDTVVAEDTFEVILKFAEDKPSLGAVGCQLINGVGEFLPESKRNIPFFKVAFKKLFGNDSNYYANHLNKNNIGEVDILVGAFMLLKKKAFKEVGGFDEDYFMYGEDIDLSYKLLKAGYQNYYFGKSKIIHFKGESTLRDKNYAQRFYGAMQIFYQKHFKRNIVFDLLVWLGIRIIPFIKNHQTPNLKHVSNYILISDKINDSLRNSLSKALILKDKMDNFPERTEVILDANFVTYKSIIELIDKHSNTSSWTYKILAKNSRFVIGSDNSSSRGEIIKF
ncbi:MAG: glycosyltransferase family 2 protein [Jejuia sp.]